jgi:uncharacterized membrane protein YhhN
MAGTTGLSKVQRTLLALICVCALVRLLPVLTDSVGDRPFSIAAKELTTIVIILLALSGAQASTRYRNLIVLGLLFAVVGHFFDVRRKEWFAFSVGSFLLMHACNAVAFSVGIRWRRGDWLYALPFVAYGGTTFAVLVNGMREQAVASLVYAVVMTLMGWRATIRCLARRSDLSGQAAIGAAVVYFLSDSLMAWQLFGGGGNTRWSLPAIWLTYCFAQVLTALSVVWAVADSGADGAGETRPRATANEHVETKPANHS